MKLALPALILIGGASVAFAGPVDVEWQRLQRWLYPPPPAAAPVAAPPAVIIPPPVEAPIIPPRTAPEPVPKIAAPKAIIAPERKPKPKHRATSSLPPCSVIRREYARMTYAQQIAAYMAATAEQVAHGKRCLGMT